MGIDSYIPSGRNLQRKAFGPWLDGVNETTEPHLLKPSELTNAENVDFDSFVGRTTKRPSFRLQAIAGGNNIPGLTEAPQNAFTADFDGKEVLFITDNNKIVYTEDLVTFATVKKYDLTDFSFTSGAQPQFTQGQNKVWITSQIDPVMSIDSAFTLLIHDKQKTGTVNNSAPITFVATSGLAVNELKGKTLVLGLRAVGLLPENAGVTRTITSNTATQINFSSIPAGDVADTDVIWYAGVRIPKAAYGIAHFETLFVADTEDSRLEVRFADNVDPNVPALDINADHPLAWPNENQLLFDAGSGDRLWGFSPPYRNRFAVMKDSGIYRIDPDPVFKFVPNQISKEVGSRFPRSWVEVGNILKFLGARSDGLPDLFYTDFVSVKDFNRKHANTLDNLKQPKQTAKAFTIATDAGWQNGNASTTSEISGGAVAQGAFDTQAEWEAAAASSNIDTRSSPGKISILGKPIWELRYEGDVKPEFAAPVWTVDADANALIGIDAGRLKGGPAAGGSWIRTWDRLGFLSPARNSYLSTKILRLNGLSGGPVIGLWNGAYGVWWNLVLIGSGSGGTAMRYNTTSISIPGLKTDAHVYNILLRSDGFFSLWIDGVLADSGMAGASTVNAVRIMYTNTGATDAAMSTRIAMDGEVWTDYLYYTSTFTDQAIPSTLPSSGQIDMLIDYKKAISANPSLHRFGKYHLSKTLNGQTLTLSSASSVDNSAYSSFFAFTDGQEPALDNSTPIRRYLKVRLNFSSTEISLSPEVAGLAGGVLHITEPISISQFISRWGNFAINNNNPGGVTRFRIRKSNNVGSPNSLDETGWDTALGDGLEGWIDITDGSALATIFAEAPGAVSTRWVQVLQEFHAAAYPSGIETFSLSLNWLEGATELLPVFAKDYKKKYILVAASSAATQNDIAIVTDKNNAFVNWTGFSINFLVLFRGVIYAGRADNTNRQLLRLDSSIKSDQDVLGVDTPIAAFIETNEEYAGEIYFRKKLRYLECVADVQTSSVNFSYRRDGTAIFVPLNTVDFTANLGHQRLHFPIGIQAKRFNLRAENVIIGEDLALETMVAGVEMVPSMSGE